MTNKIIIGIVILVGIVLLALFIFNLWLNYQQSQPFRPTEKEARRRTFYEQPASWFVQNLKKSQIQLDGQTLNPKFQYMFEEYGDTENLFKIMKKLFATSLGRKLIRNRVDRDWSLFTKESRPMKASYQLEVKGRHGHIIPIRIYIPDTAEKEELLPVLVYAHGGGFLFGSIKALDNPVQLIANTAKVVVVSLDYRLAPEYTYPAPSEDGEDVFEWTKEHIQEYGGNPKKIAFGGDSGGGLIAINVAQRQLEQGKPTPKSLLLYYPATKFPMDDDRSYELFGKGFGLDATFVDYLLTKVFPGQDKETICPDKYISPLHSVSLEGMPPAIIATAGFDILRDSGRKFAEKLDSDKVSVTYYNYPSLTHSFLQYSGIIQEAEQATIETAQLLGEELRKENN